jgi:hypothetical protein
MGTVVSAIALRILPLRADRGIGGSPDSLRAFRNRSRRARMPRQAANAIVQA